MTTVIGLICSDGLVIGADTKVTAGGIKWAEEKLFAYGQLKQRSLVVAGAGSARHVDDAISWLEMSNLDTIIGQQAEFSDFLERVVEVRLPQFAQEHRAKYGDNPDLDLIIGYVDDDGISYLVQIYDDGDYDNLSRFAAVGSGSIFGEVLLRRLYHEDITVDLAERLVGYLTWEIQTVDNHSGEGMQIVSIRKDGKAVPVGPSKIEAYKYLPELASNSYISLRQYIENIDLDRLEAQIDTLNALVLQLGGDVTITPEGQ